MNKYNLDSNFKLVNKRIFVDNKSNFNLKTANNEKNCFLK